MKSTNYIGPGVKPDVKYGSILASKFINNLMRRGKKTKAEKIFYSALDILGKKVSDKDPLTVFETAVNNIKPMVEVKSRRVGGASYQVPVEVSERRKRALAIRWILEAARSKKNKPMSLRLASEFLDAYNKEGAAMTVRENTHRMAEANKAFAHFAWR